jgi:hypothetical protein
MSALDQRNLRNSSISHDNSSQIMKTSEIINAAVYNVYTKFERETTSIKLSEAKSLKVSSHFSIFIGIILTFWGTCTSKYEFLDQ